MNLHLKEKLMPYSRNIIQSSFLVAFAALAIMMSGSACNNADFASGNTKRDGIGLKEGRPGTDANDGVDTDGGNDTDGKDSDGNDADSDGGNDSGDGKDDGLEGSDNADGDDDGIEGNDTGDNDDIGGDSGETSKKTRSDLKIVQTREDDKHRVKVELLIKGKVSKMEEIASPGKGKEAIMKDMCRKGLDTCVRVTFIGKLTQVAGGAQCVFSSPVGATSVKLDVDTNGAGFLGSCKPDEDETYTFSCDEAKSLKVQGCNG